MGSFRGAVGRQVFDGGGFFVTLPLEMCQIIPFAYLHFIGEI